jgi:DHA2 family multidrug resistance protein-like MFS transporter
MTPDRATRREWTGLAIIALPCLVYAMDLTVLNLAVPAISASLSPSSAQLLWIIDIYGFLVAGFLITMGTLGDRIGRRRLLLIGAAAFAAASVVAAFAHSVATLIAMRALLGIAGATLAPSTLSLIRNMFHDAQQRQFAIGVWIASFSLGGVIGPLVGGIVLQWFDWGAIFLVAVPVMLLLLVLGPKLLPEYKDPNAGRIDAASVLLSIGAVLASIYGLKQLAEQGVSIGALAVLAAGLALGVAFVRRQSRLAYPLLDLQLFRRPAFSAAIAAYGLSCLAMFGMMIFITQYLQGVLGLSALQAGLATVPWSAAFLVGSLLAPRLARGRSVPRIMVGGLVVAAFGFLMLGFVDHRFGLQVLIAATVVMSLALAPVFTLGNEVIVTTAPPERAGAASALSETSAEFSGALGIALLGSLGTLLYRGRLDTALPPQLPASLPAEALATLGSTLATAQSLPGPAAATLAAAARTAFVGTLELIALIAAGIVALAALIAARILRGPRPLAKAAAEPPGAL